LKQTYRRLVSRLDSACCIRRAKGLSLLPAAR
jgi:hypothetical protein